MDQRGRTKTGRKKWHNEEPHIPFYSSNAIKHSHLNTINQISRMRWARYAATRGKLTNGEPEGKRPTGRHRHKPEDNIKMTFKYTGFEM